jgi:hypothetical protein
LHKFTLTFSLLEEALVVVVVVVLINQVDVQASMLMLIEMLLKMFVRNFL